MILPFEGANTEGSANLNILTMKIQNGARWIEHTFGVLKDAGKRQSLQTVYEMFDCSRYPSRLQRLYPLQIRVQLA